MRIFYKFAHPAAVAGRIPETQAGLQKTSVFITHDITEALKTVSPSCAMASFPANAESCAAFFVRSLIKNHHGMPVYWTGGACLSI